MTKKQEIEKIMKSLKCSYDEAVEIWNDDNSITDSNVNNDLSKEQKKAIKSMTNVKDHKKSAYDFSKRERKVDEEKKQIIADMFDFLNKNYSVKIVKAEGEIALQVGENSYTVKLIKHRPPKN